MPIRTPIAVLLIVATLAALDAAPEGVRISAIVTDRQGKSVAGLTLKDFELREDGVVQKLVSVEPRRPQPRGLAILLDEFHVDAAASAPIREAVARFIDERLRTDDTAVVLKPLDPLTSIRLSADRARLHAAVAGFEGRKGNREPRNLLEEETMGRAPALVDASRAQVVLSALRALVTQLGSAPGRSAILLVSEGFPQQPTRLGSRGLPDIGIVERFANRYDVPIYVFDPRPAATPPDTGPILLGKLVSETGGTLSRGADLAGDLARAAAEMDGGYTLTYQPARPDDGRYHPVQITVAARRELDARSRGGYVSAPSADAQRAMREAAGTGPALPMRLLRRSPLIDVWSGVTRIGPTGGRVVVTWEPGRNFTGTGKSSAARVALKATTKEGAVLYEGLLAPVRVGEAADPASSDRAEFDAPAGRVQLEMTIVGIRGEKLDVDARDVDMPPMKGTAPMLLPAILIATQSAREFREVTADADAAPDPSRQFRRTERLVIRVPAYAGGAPVPVTARLLNRLAQPILEIGTLPAVGGVTQFDLPLAPLAPGEYYLLFTVTGPAGSVDQRISFRITG